MTTTERYRQALEKIKNDNGGEGCGYSYYRLKEIASEALASATPNENDDEKDLFAMNFLAWYNHGEDAQVYKAQGASTYDMLKLYKDRPFLRTDIPEQN